MQHFMFDQRPSTVCNSNFGAFFAQSLAELVHNYMRRPRLHCNRFPCKTSNYPENSAQFLCNACTNLFARIMRQSRARLRCPDDRLATIFPPRLQPCTLQGAKGKQDAFQLHSSAQCSVCTNFLARRLCRSLASSLEGHAATLIRVFFF